MAFGGRSAPPRGRRAGQLPLPEAPDLARRPARCGAATHTPPLPQFEIRQLRAHLAQQDLDLAAEREEALRAPQVLRRPRGRYHVLEEVAHESFVEELQPSPGKPCAMGDPAPLRPQGVHPASLQGRVPSLAPDLTAELGSGLT